MSEWLIGLLVFLGLCCIPVVMGIVTKCGGGTFGDGLLLFGGLVAGADALERALGAEPRCPWPDCNYDLQAHRSRHPTACPACRRPIRWLDEGRRPTRDG